MRVCVDWDWTEAGAVELDEADKLLFPLLPPKRGRPGESAACEPAISVTAGRLTRPRIGGCF